MTRKERRALREQTAPLDPAKVAAVLAPIPPTHRVPTIALGLDHESIILTLANGTEITCTNSALGMDRLVRYMILAESGRPLVRRPMPAPQPRILADFEHLKGTGTGKLPKVRKYAARGKAAPKRKLVLTLADLGLAD